MALCPLFVLQVNEVSSNDNKLCELMDFWVKIVRCFKFLMVD
jgi:hypothetical protein